MTRCDVCLELVPFDAIWDETHDVIMCTDCYERIADRAQEVER
jgi:hypothetical protein